MHIMLEIPRVTHESQMAYFQWGPMGSHRKLVTYRLQWKVLMCRCALWQFGPPENERIRPKYWKTMIFENMSMYEVSDTPSNPVEAVGAYRDSQVLPCF